MLRLSRQLFRHTRQARLPQVAGSLAFTTVLSLVPLFTVAFALFTHFPLFRRFERAIEDQLVRSLLPTELSRTVMGHVHRFAANADSLTWLGTLALLATSVALLLTIENALNQLWDVRQPRPFLRRVVLYLLVLAVGPVLLGLSLWATSAVVGVSVGWLGPLPPAATFALGLGPLALTAIGLSALYRFVPHAPVRWGHAVAGGLLAALALEAGKRGFTAWVTAFPTYTAVYGAFATLPIFLLWVYLSWLVTLAGGVLVAGLGGHGAPPPRAPRPRRRPV